MNNLTPTNYARNSLVPVWSATLGDRQPNRTIYARNVDHISLVSDADCLNYISQLIGGDDTIPENSKLFQEMIFDND